MVTTLRQDERIVIAYLVAYADKESYKIINSNPDLEEKKENE